MRQLLLAAACLLAAGAAHAQSVATDQAIGRAPVVRPAPAPTTLRTVSTPGLVATMDAAGLVAALQRAGFTAETKSEDGRSYVLGRDEGVTFQAFLGGCRASGDGCTDIELYAGFQNKKIAWERINGWNARTRFARAFLDESGDAALQMDIGLVGGVSQDGLKTSLETWGSALETYSLFLLARVPPVGAAQPKR